MKKQASFLITIFFILAIWSCKDEDDIPQSCNECPEDISAFSQLAIGNYWVYEIQKVDSNGVFIEETGIDSLYISGDTVINGLTYYIRKGTSSLFNGFRKTAFLRDSSHYLVNEKGEILFSTTDFDTVIKRFEDINGFYTIEYMMTDKDLEIETPAGFFVTSNFQGIVHFNEELINVHLNDRPIKNRYASGVGLVESNVFFASSSDDLIRRLLHYHIQ